MGSSASLRTPTDGVATSSITCFQDRRGRIPLISGITLDRQPGRCPIRTLIELTVRCEGSMTTSARHLAGHQQVLAPVDRDDEVAALAELAEPRPLCRRPRREARAAGLVRILMAGLIRARPGAGPRARQPPPAPPERHRPPPGSPRPGRPPSGPRPP